MTTARAKRTPSKAGTTAASAARTPAPRSTSSKAPSKTATARAGAYTLVIADGSPGYVAPHDPTCPDQVRYLAVRLVQGNDWGIVDRRMGRLVRDTRPEEHRYASWDTAAQVVRTLNTSGAG